MKVRIERCWVGGTKCFNVRATVVKDGTRHIFNYNNNDGEWDRALATEIRDYFQRFYNANRSSIKFV